MSDRNINDLDPELRSIYLQWLQECMDAGLTVHAIVTWRSPEDQEAAAKAGLSNAGAGQSPHNCTIAGKPAARAFDFGVFELDGSYVQDGKDPRYTEAAVIAKKLGLVWGGDFRSFPDYDHLQMPNWRSA